METLTIAQTARHLGVSDTATRKMIGRQELFILPGSEPARLDAAAVETVRLLRREDILLDLVRQRTTPVELARQTRKTLRLEASTLPHRRAEAQRLHLSLVRPEARQLFGVAALSAAQAEDAACRWCLSQDFARVLGGWAPSAYSEAYEALFGAKPCGRCGPGLFGAVMASLSTRVHGGPVRPSEGSVRASAAEREAAREWALQQPVRAAAKPVQDDGGRDLVARRLRETRAALKTARRTGDSAYAASLMRTLTALTADAAVVDGRTPAALPGMLRCGHALAAGCSCPRRASKRSTS